MKIALLADIHGNLQALNAVLNHAKNNKVDKFIIAGDHISDCPSPNETLDIIQNLDAYIIKGNREDYIINELKSNKNSWAGLKQMESVLWTKKILTKNNLDWIKKLPETLHINHEQTKSILLVHGSPYDQFEHLSPDNIERLTEVLDNIKEEVLICGHSHRPWSLKVKDKLAINPGSVGVAFNKQVAADYVIMEWNKNNWKSKHYSIPYNITKLEDDFKFKGIEKFMWSKLILASLKDGENRNIEFIQLAQKIMKENNKIQTEYISNEIWDKTIHRWYKKVN